MSEIPQEAVQAAVSALEKEIGPLSELELERLRIAVEAAAPVLAAHIARQIRAQQPAGNTQLTFESGIRRAARVARDAFPRGDDRA